MVNKLSTRATENMDRKVPIQTFSLWNCVGYVLHSSLRDYSGGDSNKYPAGTMRIYSLTKERIHVLLTK